MRTKVKNIQKVESNVRERKIQTQKEEIKKTLENMGFDLSMNGVIATEDMIPEEEEFELIVGFLKEGYSFEEAKNKARTWIQIMKSL